MNGDHVAVAIAETFRGSGAILVSPMGALPRLGAQLAQATFEPDLLLSDGVATLVDLQGQRVGWMPFSRVFDTLWGGRRHVMMGASQLDKYGNQNISALGSHTRPKVQLLGVRGAPGNTACHPTSYFVAAHSRRIFVPQVDVICGLGTNRGALALHRVITNLGVFDFSGPEGTLRIRCLHPGVSLEQVQASTGFPLTWRTCEQFDADDADPSHRLDAAAPGDSHPLIPISRGPTPEEAAWLERLDPARSIRKEVE